MAGAFFAGLASDVLGSGLSSLIGAGANAINQKVEYDYNRHLQSASFQHDKDMLNSQVEATKHLQREMMAIKEGMLLKGGFSPTDAARGAVNAPMTQILDWNGTRYWAPGAMKTTAYSGRFVSQSTHRPIPNVVHKSDGPIHQTGSTTGSISSLSTSSTRVPSSTSSSSSASRTRDWVSEQQRLSPFMRGSLHTAYVTPPSSSASSVSSVSTVPHHVLDSWTPSFNTKHLPLFAHVRKRGQSQV
ncbi:VP2 [Norovirus GIX]|uniref:VP2 n=1 Tax=Norovirus GIX TaxID=2594528 RepID=A0A517B722_NORV|nr:VP2 [Norovirus GIX]QDR48019.1 VP2 [Norovirus GIX]QHR97559.1 VP2 [Norovirus GIX]QHR97562.1 VP2 [Norovirus GIX]